MTIHKSRIPAHKTRALIQQKLKHEGAMNASSLGDSLGVTAMAIRQHLYEMEQDGLIASSNEKNTRGRPTKKWYLTPKSDSLFADSHGALTVELIDAVRSCFGDAGLERIIAKRAVDQTRQYKEVMNSEHDLESRLTALAQQRTAEGYMAAVARDEAGGFLFIENHCPVCQAARQCSGLCAAELDVFRLAFGPDISVERQDHILLGARRCVYSVKPATHAA